MLGQLLSENSGLFLSEIMRSVLLLFVFSSRLFDSLLTDHGKDLSDGFSRELETG